MKLFYSYDLDISRAYIIRLSKNDKSVTYANRCSQSCDAIKQPWSYWEGYDGSAETIIKPNHHISGSIIDMIKITDHYLTRGEVACALSHISLWQRCVLEDTPLIVLEHDSVMIAPYYKHQLYNSICYLGGHEQATQGWSVNATPPHATEGPNYHFICRAHAYSIDPAVAKNMLAHILRLGIHAPLDIMLRADIFNIHQVGLFAYNIWNGDKTNTTIDGRPLEGRSTIRNDELAI